MWWQWRAKIIQWGVFLDLFDTGVIGLQPRAPPSERLLLDRGVAATYCEHQGQVILHRPVNVRIGNSIIAALGARAFDAQPFENVENLR